jgi:hypothetical protein
VSNASRGESSMKVVFRFLPDLILRSPKDVAEDVIFHRNSQASWFSQHMVQELHCGGRELSGGVTGLLHDQRSF